MIKRLKAVLIPLVIIIIGRLIAQIPAQVTEPAQTATASITDTRNPISINSADILSTSQLKALGFKDQDIKQAGFVSGMSRIALKYAQEKAKYEKRYNDAKDRADLNRRMGKKVSKRDKAIIDQYEEQQRNKNKPKFTKRNLFGNALCNWLEWRKGSNNQQNIKQMDWSKGIENYFNPPLSDLQMQTVGQWVSIGGVLYLMKVLVPIII